MLQMFGLVVILILFNINESKSHKTLIYEDMGCTKIKTNPNENSTKSYNCSHVFEDGCSYKSEKYVTGQTIPPSTALLSCSTSCRCKQNGFVCAILRCPEVGHVTLPNGTCHHIYTLNECCNRGYICPPFDKVAVCEVDGKKYFEGQIFYPSNTNLRCVCRNGFEGKYVAPFCRKVECGIQLKYPKELKSRCAPMYEKGEKIIEPRNCPSSWICPNEENKDVIVSSSKQDSPVKCFYGDLLLSLGEYFERERRDYFARGDNIIRCKCVVPPLLTCDVSRTIPWDK